MTVACIVDGIRGERRGHDKVVIIKHWDD